MSLNVHLICRVKLNMWNYWLRLKLFIRKLKYQIYRLQLQYRYIYLCTLGLFLGSIYLFIYLFKNTSLINLGENMKKLYRRPPYYSPKITHVKTFVTSIIRVRSEQIRFLTVHLHFTQGNPGVLRMPLSIRRMSSVVVVDDKSPVVRTGDVERIKYRGSVVAGVP